MRDKKGVTSWKLSPLCWRCISFRIKRSSSLDTVLQQILLACPSRGEAWCWWGRGLCPWLVGGKQGKGTHLYPLLSGTILTFVSVLFFALLLNIFSTVIFSENCFATVSFSKSTTLGGCLSPLVCLHTCTCTSPLPQSHKTILLTVTVIVLSAENTKK